MKVISDSASCNKKTTIHLLLMLYDEVSYSFVFYSFSFQWFVDDLHFYWSFYGCCLMVTWYAPTTYIFVFGSLSWISWIISNLCNVQFRFKCIFPPNSKSQFEISQIWRYKSLVFDLISFFSLNFFVRKKRTNPLYIIWEALQLLFVATCHH